jgi:hypothetical protein
MNAIVIKPGRITSIPVFGQASGSIAETKVFNAVSPVTYSWETLTAGASAIKTQDLSAKYNLSAGVYRLTVTDADNRVAHSNFIISENQMIKIYPGLVTDVLIYGTSTGSIARTTVTGGNGNYTSYWSSDDSATDISQSHNLQPKLNLAAGTYTLRVVDGVGAEAVHDFVVSQSNKLTIHFGKIRNAPIMGRGSGYIAESKITGGVQPYTFNWIETGGGGDIPVQVPLNRYDVDVVSTKHELKPGIYKLVVTDAVGAQANHVFKIREGPTKVLFEFGGSHNFYRRSD